MGTKTPADFPNHEDWLSYVRQEVSVPEQASALVAGRTELFRNFYRVRNLPFPDEFAVELARIELLGEPERTSELEHLNHRIFANLTTCLFDKTPASSPGRTEVRLSPDERISELLDHLRKKNPYFALWSVYKRHAAETFNEDEWEEYLVTELGADSSEEAAFTRSMVELDKLLAFFQASGRSLPEFAFERIWFLHYLRGSERMAQTRAILNMLAAEM